MGDGPKVTDDIRELLPLTMAFYRIERLMKSRPDLFHGDTLFWENIHSGTVNAILALPNHDKLSDEQLIAFLTARKLTQ